MIYVLLADGFEEIEALTPVDILRRANLTVKTVGITGKSVTGTHGITVQADITPDEANEKIELLVLPGGMPGAENLDRSPALDPLIQKAIADGGMIGAICAAPFVLGKRDLLLCKRFTCFPGFEKGINGFYCPNERVVCDGRMITAVGMGAAGEFSFALLTAMGHEQEAKRIAAATFYGESTYQFATNEFLQKHPNANSLLHAGMQVAFEYGKLSASLLQRKLSIGYGIAARLLTLMVQLKFIEQGERNTYPVTITPDEFAAWAAGQNE